MQPKIPAYHELMWPTLQAVQTLGGSATNAEILKQVIESAHFPEELQSIPHNDGSNTELNYRLAWGRTYLKIVGALTNSAAGVWSITEAGKALKQEDMREIPSRVRKLKRVLQHNPGDSTDATEDHEGDSPQEQWKGALLAILQQIEPAGFERLSQRMLREHGFIDVAVTGRSGDGGIDGIGVLRVGLLTFRVAFQCKRFKGTVGVSEVRDFRGALQGRAEKGILITTGSFTDGARREARRDGANPIDLIDGEEFCDLLKQRGIGIEIVETVAIKSEFFNSI